MADELERRFAIRSAVGAARLLYLRRSATAAGPANLEPLVQHLAADLGAAPVRHAVYRETVQSQHSHEERAAGQRNGVAQLPDQGKAELPVPRVRIQSDEYANLWRA